MQLAWVGCNGCVKVEGGAEVGNVEVGDVAKFSCPKGYSMIGKNESICLPYGGWFFMNFELV